MIKHQQASRKARKETIAGLGAEEEEEEEGRVVGTIASASAEKERIAP
jgi:hypothetical protein